MTAVEPVTTSSAPSVNVSSACMACGHERDAHDQVAQRFCDATIARAATRGCLCKVAAGGHTTS